jgi:hypothetical protein
MRQRRARRLPVADWPPAFDQLLRSAALECPAGHADALADLLALAIRKAPARGVFDPAAKGEHDLFAAIEAIARKHLALADAETAWRDALRASGLTVERRDALERAAVQIQTASDTTYYYAGLSFGLAFFAVYRADTG